MQNDRSHVRPNQTVRVGAKSDPRAVAGALAHALRKSPAVTIRVIGAAAVNQAVKAIAIAAEHMASEFVDIAVVPSFEDIEVDGIPKTCMKLRVIRLQPLT